MTPEQHQWYWQGFNDAKQEQKRPQNCGTSFCSCIECVMDEQEQGEPVAWGVIASNTGRLCQVELDFAEVEDLSPKWVIPLYTTPQQPSTIVRKPLTDEQIETIRQQPQHHKGEFDYEFNELSFARAIEAAHGITEEKNT